VPLERKDVAATDEEDEYGRSVQLRNGAGLAVMTRKKRTKTELNFHFEIRFLASPSSEPSAPRFASTQIPRLPSRNRSARWKY
jgi:hypothetical protein